LETSKLEEQKAEVVVSKAKGIGGVNPRTHLEYMRIKAWMAYLMAKSGAVTYGDLNERLLSTRPKSQLKFMYKEEMGFPHVRWDKHWKLETGPNESRLNLIDKMPLGAGSKAVYEVGPQDNGVSIPLWLSFETDFNLMWSLVDAVVADMPDMRKRGAPFATRMECVISLFVPKAEWEQIDFKDPANHPKLHVVLAAYQAGHFEPSFKLLAAAMAMYRLVVNAGESMAQMEYLLRGLLGEPYRDLLSSYNIYTEFLAAFNQLEINDFISRGDLESAENILEKMRGEPL
jgi:hypothetical protein